MVFRFFYSIEWRQTAQAGVQDLPECASGRPGPLIRSRAVLSEALRRLPDKAGICMIAMVLSFNTGVYLVWGAAYFMIRLR
jgi:hypothetical protein